METKDPPERKFEAIAEKVWRLSQSTDAKGHTLERDWDSVLRLAREPGLDKGHPRCKETRC